MPEEIKYEFNVIEFNCPVDGLHYRYTLHKDGWQWGRFTNREKCEEIGRLHFDRAVKHDNDWGIPMDELKSMKHIPQDVGDYI